MKMDKKQVNLIIKKIDEKLVKFSFLAKGNHKDNYLIQTAKNKYILRIENNPQFNNLKKEYKILKIVEKLNFGPKVYLFDNSHKIITKDYLLEEFISGKHPKRKVDKGFVILMAKWFKKLHSLKISKKPENMKGKYFSLIEAIKPYLNGGESQNLF